RQNHDAVDPARRAHPNLRRDQRARCRHAAVALQGVAADEFHVAVCRPAETFDRARKPARLRRSVWCRESARADHRAQRRIRSWVAAQTAIRRIVGRQRTRVSLAKALINRPEVLLLDEPTASLDPDVGDRMRTYLETYQRSSGCTVLLASHNMSEVERMCDDVIMLRAGLVVDQGAPEALVSRYGRDSMEEVFLDIARGRVTHDEADAATAEGLR